MSFSKALAARRKLALPRKLIPLPAPKPVEEETEEEMPIAASAEDFEEEPIDKVDLRAIIKKHRFFASKAKELPDDSE